MPLQSLSKQLLNNIIKSNAQKLGFFDCGISKAEYLCDDAERVEEWLRDGNNGEMSYLEKNRDKRYNPTLLVEGAKSVITVLYNYYPNQKLPETSGYKISKYAYGNDYHYVIKEKLKQLLNVIEEKTVVRNARVFTDSAPLLDRAWARKSGLGFTGKNKMLINKKGGSYFFIGHIILDAELHYEDNVEVGNYCGSCTKCIDACPTNAIKTNYVDARRCISYLTIEYRGELEQSSKKSFDKWIFGCDICQDVCPWNRFATPHNEPLFEPSKDLLNMNKQNFDELDRSHFKKLFNKSAIMRTGYKGLKRNISLFQ